MAAELLHYNDELHILICKAHGFALQPSLTAIARHLRSKSHRLGKSALRRTLEWAKQLRLAPTSQVLSAQQSCQSIVAPILHLSVVHGFMCTFCMPPYLTTSADLMKRHNLKNHKARATATNVGTVCELQTLFSETKHRHYFRVSTSAARRAPIATNGDEFRYAYEPGVMASLPRCLGVSHPYAVQAKRHIGWLPESMLDTLFKSEALRLASRPLFDTTHVDSCTNMSITFQLRDREPAFYSALVYSMVSLTYGESKLSLLLEKLSVEALYQQIRDRSGTSHLSTIGTILLLKTTAYKLSDRRVHEVHERGLIAFLSNSGTGIQSPAARRGYFWQDLLAAVFMRSPRSTSIGILPALLSSNTPSESSGCGPKNATKEPLAPGFVRYRHELPTGLLDCVKAVTYLQSSCQKLVDSSYKVRYETLDIVQACTESLLVDHMRASESAGPIAYSVWLATFICSYCSWLEVWSDITLPCKLSADLLRCVRKTLQESSLHRLWGSRVDLLLWVLGIASSVADLKSRQTIVLRQQRTQVLQLAKLSLQNYPSALVKSELERARQDFLYYDSWRCYIEEVVP